MSVRRLATLACGVLVIVLGHAAGGYGGAAVVGLGLGLVVVGMGRREPHLLRRRDDAAPRDDGLGADDHDDDDEDGGASRWSQW